jgi:glycine/D-amino acid oxidase-like deaminating enzyme
MPWPVHHIIKTSSRISVRRKTALQEMAVEGTTAQVHPQKLTKALLDQALINGAKLVRGAVQGVILGGDGKTVEGGAFGLLFYGKFC